MQYIQLQGQVASTLESPSNGAFNLFVDTSDNTIKVKDENGNLIGGGGASITEVTYSELSASFAGADLTPGQYYKITDYQTFYDQPNFDASGTPITTGNYKSGSIEELVVFATSTGSLSPYAHSLTYPKDTIKYNVAVTQTEVTNGVAKGRIYERIDEAGNRTDYDWRAVQFKRYTSFYCESTYNGKVSLTATGTTGSITGIGTNFDNNFSVGDVVGIYNPNTTAIGGFDIYEVVDISGSYYMGVTGSYYNEISDTYFSSPSNRSGLSPFQTNTVSVLKDTYEYYTFDTDGEGTPANVGWYNNYLGDNSEWNTFVLSNNVFLGGNYADNHFGSNVVGNTFQDDDYGNNCGYNFQYNIIQNDFDNNQIGDNFQKNFVECDMQENIIGNEFRWNMIGDYEGIDFNFNIINGENFQHNWINGDDHFHSNIISDDFSYNIVHRKFGNNVVTNNVSNNFFQAVTEFNQFKESFSSNKIYDTFKNNVLNYFDNNIVLDGFDRNHLNGSTSYNVFSGSFIDNNIGHNFYENTFLGIAGNNQIGIEFHNNTIGDGFGNGGGGPIGNKIGGNVYGNVIGTNFQGNTISNTFYDNTIGNNFQQNTILANAINNIDFNQYYGNIYTFTLTNGNGWEVNNGVYTATATTTNGGGTGATFDLTFSNGDASVTLNQSGKLYEINDTLYITGSVFGGGDSNLEITIDTISPTPVVYTTADSTIVRNYNDDLKLTYVGSSLGIVNITEPFD